MCNIYMFCSTLLILKKRPDYNHLRIFLRFYYFFPIYVTAMLLKYVPINCKLCVKKTLYIFHMLILADNFDNKSLIQIHCLHVFL